MIISNLDYHITSCDICVRYSQNNILIYFDGFKRTSLGLPQAHIYITSTTNSFIREKVLNQRSLNAIKCVENTIHIYHKCKYRQN